MKLRIQVWILVMALSLSPLIAQNPSQQKLNHDNSLIGISIRSLVPPTAEGVSNVQGSGTKPTSPGRSYGTLIGILILAGGVVAASLAFTGKENKPPIVPVVRPGTVVTPGTPSINPPTNR
jgi:hypothetical protein